MKFEIKQLKIIFTLYVLVCSVYIGKSQDIQRDTIFAKQLLIKVDSLTEEGKYKESNTLALQTVSILQKAEKWTLWFKAHKAIFYNFYYAKDTNSCIPIIKKGIAQLPDSEVKIHGEMQFILGFCYNATGRIFDSLDAYKQNLKNSKKAKDTLMINLAYGNISQIYTQLGEYQKVIPYLKGGIEYGKSINDSIIVWKNLKALGDAYLFLKNLKKAQETYKSAQKIIDNKDGTFELYEAEILYKLEEYEKALVTAKKTLLITEKCKKEASKNQQYCITNFNTVSILLGDIYAKLGKHKKALDLYKQSINHIKEEGNLREIGKVQLSIGDTYKALKKYDKALANHQKALQTFIPDFTENDPSINPSQELWTLEIWLMEIFKSKGDCYIEMYHDFKNEAWLHKAIENYNLAITFGEKIRLNYTETNSKLLLGSHTNTFYKDLIKAKLILHKRTKDDTYIAEAFQIAQRANAFVLRELVNEQAALKAAGIPMDKIDLFQNHRKQIATLDEKIEYSENKDSLQNVLVTKKEAFQELKDLIAINYPKFTKLRNDLEGISVKEVQHNLNSNTLFLKYFFGKESIYVFSISKEKFFIDQIKLPENFQELIDTYRQSLSDIVYINNNLNLAEKQYLQTAFELYKTILEKPLSHYRNNTKIQQLTVIPDGVLHTIPFQTLLTNKSDSWIRLDNAIVKKYAVSYHYFSKMLVQSPEELRRTNKFTSFGLELDETTLEYLQTVTKDSLHNNLTAENLRNGLFSKLSFSDDEALQLATLMHGKSWTNEQATKTNFIENATNSTSIHLATHALVNTQNPNISALIFTKTTDNNSNLLSLNEIYNHNFNSSMITLSACNTGFGKYQKGEGLQSLARAFNFSNVPSVTATLWSIPDASSASIMKLYYTNLKQGMSKSVALQKAQLEYLQNDEISSPASRLPFYWAAWTHIGMDEAITFQPENNYINYFTIAFICILVFAVVLWFKKTRQS
ncbi:CHAT domain-containing tetratricopeptide repeat protein [uncultured Kordia sp.]|uniref:CHAT domain-containing protein n=1 Tax=uncultured Kordia sp. TaxID=507699 RepID=UPI00262E5913|nr:CHAT domain-containing tetratricopeptide repeat protein [uncultured Kordia sp.]